MSSAETEESTSGKPHRRRAIIVGVLKVALPVIILATGGGLALGLMETGPKAVRKPPVRAAKLVEVAPVAFTRTAVTIDAMGTVQPDRQVALKPQVSGDVTWLSAEFVPGGVLEAGEQLLKLNPRDYQLVVRQHEADLAKAESSLKIEQGQQSIAKREYELLGRTVKPEDRGLVLRQPQLTTADAAVQAAKASLDQAKLDLERTTVRVPFNAVIQSRDVNLGAQATTSTTLATLVGTDSYLIQAAVPVDQLKWLKIPRRSGEAGSPVRVYNDAAWGANVYRIGHVIRLASALESEGRMAQLLIAVDDPLALKDANASKPVLLIGTYVRVAIEGITVGPVAEVDRKLLHDGDVVWVMTPDARLDIRTVTPLFKGHVTVLLDKGLREGEQIITSALAAPVPGMALRTGDTERAEARVGANPADGAAGRPAGRRPGGEGRGSGAGLGGGAGAGGGRP